MQASIPHYSQHKRKKDKKVNKKKTIGSRKEERSPVLTAACVLRMCLLSLHPTGWPRKNSGTTYWYQVHTRTPRQRHYTAAENTRCPSKQPYTYQGHATVARPSRVERRTGDKHEYFGYFLPFRQHLQVSFHVNNSGNICR